MRIINKDLKWQNDRDIPKRIWDTYMKQFGDRYRLEMDENNVWHIKCRFGTIQLYSLINQQLCFSAEFRSKRHKTWFQKTLSKHGTIVQDTDLGIVYVFDEKFLDSMADSLILYKKKNISEEHRRILVKHIKHAREARKK